MTSSHVDPHACATLCYFYRQLHSSFKTLGLRQDQKVTPDPDGCRERFAEWSFVVVFPKIWLRVVALDGAARLVVKRD